MEASMDGFLNQLTTAIRAEFSDLPDVASVVRLICRLAMAAALGGLLGWQREKAGKAAGMRTHMLVCLGATLFVAGPQFTGMGDAGLSRIIQGLTAGIGFVGAGAILKIDAPARIYGLTTAAGIWMTAAIGVMVGLGRGSTALVSTAMAFVILWLLPSEPHPPQGASSGERPSSEGKK
jgi:putative Mg2+ transporter-C (MgtC) family protein